jgi:uncharacterized protein (DUF1810 family)
VSEEDPHDLQRFVAAQLAEYPFAFAELRRGRKVGHWMWFVFPQIAGLGSSATSQRYAIASLEEAKAYLRHRLLGPRLLECAETLMGLRECTAQDVLGYIDAVKLRSSMTLFARAAPDEPRFLSVLERYFGGVADDATDQILESQSREARTGASG